MAPMLSLRRMLTLPVHALLIAPRIGLVIGLLMGSTVACVSCDVDGETEGEPTFQISGDIATPASFDAARLHWVIVQAYPRGSVGADGTIASGATPYVAFRPVNTLPSTGRTAWSHEGSGCLGDLDVLAWIDDGRDSVADTRGWELDARPRSGDWVALPPRMITIEQVEGCVTRGDALDFLTWTQLP